MMRFSLWGTPDRSYRSLFWFASLFWLIAIRWRTMIYNFSNNETKRLFQKDNRTIPFCYCYVLKHYYLYFSSHPKVEKLKSCDQDETGLTWLNSVRTWNKRLLPELKCYGSGHIFFTTVRHFDQTLTNGFYNWEVV